jgi:hypothetical protein
MNTLFLFLLNNIKTTYNLNRFLFKTTNNNNNNNNTNNKMEIEKIYQKKSQLEHILLRPDTYIGSVELLQQEMWIWNFESEKMVKKLLKSYK